MTAQNISSFPIGNYLVDMGQVGTSAQRAFNMFVVGAQGKFGVLGTNWTWNLDATQSSVRTQDPGAQRLHQGRSASRAQRGARPRKRRNCLRLDAHQSGQWLRPLQSLRCGRSQRGCDQLPAREQRFHGLEGVAG